MAWVSSVQKLANKHSVYSTLPLIFDHDKVGDERFLIMVTSMSALVSGESFRSGTIKDATSGCDFLVQK